MYASFRFRSFYHAVSTGSSGQLEEVKVAVAAAADYLTQAKAQLNNNLFANLDLSSLVNTFEATLTQWSAKLSTFASVGKTLSLSTSDNASTLPSQTLVSCVPILPKPAFYDLAFNYLELPAKIEEAKPTKGSSVFGSFWKR